MRPVTPEMKQPMPLLKKISAADACGPPLPDSVPARLTFRPPCETGGFDIVEAEKRWDEVAVAIRIVRNAASTHIANRLREVYREYLEKYAQAVEQVVHGLPRLMCLKFKCVITSWETGQPLYAGGATHPE